MSGQFFTRENLIEILKINFGYKTIVDEIFGNSLKLNIKESYKFCLTTNSYYLVDKYGLRLFGRFRTFNHRNFSLNPGLFLLDVKNQKILDPNLPCKLIEKYPFMFKGDKKIIFIESQNTPKVIEETYNKILKAGKNPEDYIVNLVHSNASQWEHYFEFMASELFIQQGYLTDIQLPWSYHGRPDFGAYKHKLVDMLNSMNLIENGALILELSALRLFKNTYKYKKPKRKNNEKENYEIIVGEVKARQTTSQIKKYLETGLCLKGYEFIPNKNKKETFCGLINIDHNNKIVLHESPYNKYLDPTKVAKDLDWFNCYIKMHLLGNLSLSEIKNLFQKQIHSDNLKFSNLIKLVQKIKISDLLGVIKYGL